MQQKIFTADVLRALTNNGRWNKTRHENPTDFKPVVKVFNPYGAATWLFTEIDEDGDTLFGLCDLGFGTPELGYASKSEIESTRVPVRRFAFPLERDRHFEATHPLSVYAFAARSKGQIVEARRALDQAAALMKEATDA